MAADRIKARCRQKAKTNTQGQGPGGDGSTRWVLAVDQGVAPLDVLAFEDSLSAMAGASDAAFAKQLLATTKAAHQDMRQNLQDALSQSGDGAVYVGRHSWGMDLLLGTVMRTLCTRHGAEDVALIAVGGMGAGSWHQILISTFCF